MSKPVTRTQTLGNLSAVHVTFYQGDKPTVKLGEGERACFLRYKKTGSDIEGFVQRDSMAVVVPQFSIGKIRDVERGSEFLQVLIDEAQDTSAKLCADGKIPFTCVTSAEEMIKEFFDNSRTASGARMTAENVGKFFDSAVSGWLTKRVAAKFPTFDADKVAKVVAQYRQSFADLSKYQMPHTKAVFGMLETCWLAFLAELGENEIDLEVADWVNLRLKKLSDRLNGEEMLLQAI